jgi:hypothetical protein
MGCRNCQNPPFSRYEPGNFVSFGAGTGWFAVFLLLSADDLGYPFHLAQRPGGFDVTQQGAEGDPCTN